MTWAAPTLMRNFTLSPDRVGTIMAVVVLVSGVAGPVGGGVVADYCQRTGGPYRTLSILCWLAGLSLPAGLFAVSPGVWPASFLLVVLVVLVGGAFSMGITLFTIIIPNELRGLCLAILTVAVSLFAVALTPLIVSTLSVGLGGPLMIGKALALVCTASSVLSTAAFVLGKRSARHLHLDQRVPTGPT